VLQVFTKEGMRGLRRGKPCCLLQYGSRLDDPASKRKLKVRAQVAGKWVVRSDGQQGFAANFSLKIRILIQLLHRVVQSGMRLTSVTLDPVKLPVR
jgi:hypothetical protein